MIRLTNKQWELLVASECSHRDRSMKTALVIRELTLTVLPLGMIAKGSLSTAGACSSLTPGHVRGSEQADSPAHGLAIRNARQSRTGGPIKDLPDRHLKPCSCSSAVLRDPRREHTD